MAKTIEAVYEDGVIKPLQKINLSEHQHIKITITQEKDDSDEKLRESLNKGYHMGRIHGNLDRKDIYSDID